MLVPITLFLVIGAIVIAPQVLRSIDRRKYYEAMRVAYEKGLQPTAPIDPADRTQPPLPSARELPLLEREVQTAPERDLRRGVGWTAVGAGLLVIGLIGYAVQYSYGGSVEWLATWASLGAIPLCVGLAFLALWAFSRPKRAA